MAPLLQAEQFSVELNRRTIIDRVSLAVDRGELLALVGPNGAGKTTLLRALAAIVPSNGRCEFDRRPIASFRRRQFATRVAYLPQENWMPFDLPVAQVVSLGRYALRGPFGALGAADQDAVQRAMRQVDIESLASRSINTLSGGERRRVHLARAIAQDAELLLLDEPISALDIGHACAVIEMLRGLARNGRAVLFSLHDLVLAPRVDRVVLLDRGRITAEGNAGAVLTGAAARTAFGLTLRETGDPPAIVP